ncbi:MAG: HD domain-containing protein [candidate division WOR-3 bacterium]|nr:HD domain-containing protein [candidate division WOR-3 bacterium]
MVTSKKIINTLKFNLNNFKEIITPIINLARERSIYLVGGSIRDILLNRKPNDFDFAVTGSGVEFAKEFAKRIKGTFVLLSKSDDEARVIKNNTIYDFNGIGFKQIYYDLLRRDFTINALAIDLKNSSTIIDYFNGVQHIKTRRIMPVSKNSLKLDPLRILRAFRFALELNFQVSPEVFKLAKEISLTDIAAERIQYELLRICEHPKSYPYIKQLYKLGFLSQIFPLAKELLANRDLINHSLRTYKMVECLVSQKSFFSQFAEEFEKYFANFPYRRALLKICGLLHDIAKPHTEFMSEDGDVHFYGHDNLGAKIVQRLAIEKLRLSRKQTKMLKTLIANHMRLHLLATAPELTDRAIRRFFRDLDDEYFGLMILTFADGYATAKQTDHLKRTISRMMQLKESDKKKKQIKRLITGDDLIALKYKPGPIFKVILQELEEKQLEGEITTKEQGIEYVKKKFPLSN